MLDGVDDAAILTDRDGLVVYANPPAIRLFGIDIGEAPISAASLFDPARGGQAAVSAAIDAGTRGKSAWTGPLSRIGHDGRRFTTQTRVSRVSVNGRSYLSWLERPIAG